MVNRIEEREHVIWNDANHAVFLSFKELTVSS